MRLVLVEPGTPIPPPRRRSCCCRARRPRSDDLDFLRAAGGWDVDIAAHVRRGGRVLGLCGGFQMLGRTIADPDGIEGPAGRVVDGLGLLESRDAAPRG